MLQAYRLDVGDSNFEALCSRLYIDQTKQELCREFE